jgi:hypothetical protein
MRDEDGHKAMLEAGKAWTRVKDNDRMMWHDWTMIIGPGLLKARAEAMRIAQTNAPIGRGYNEAMSALLIEYKLDDMGETARAHLLKIMNNLADIEEWRAKQDNPGDLNHPSRIWPKYQRSLKQTDEPAATRNTVKKTETELAKALQELDAANRKIEQLEAHNDELKAARDTGEAIPQFVPQSGMSLPAAIRFLSSYTEEHGLGPTEVTDLLDGNPRIDHVDIIDVKKCFDRLFDALKAEGKRREAAAKTAEEAKAQKGKQFSDNLVAGLKAGIDQSLTQYQAAKKAAKGGKAKGTGKRKGKPKDEGPPIMRFKIPLS